MYQMLFNRLDELEETYLRFLVDVCRIESPTEYKEGVERVEQYFMEKAAENGCSGLQDMMAM